MRRVPGPRSATVSGAALDACCGGRSGSPPSCQLLSSTSTWRLSRPAASRHSARSSDVFPLPGGPTSSRPGGGAPPLPPPPPACRTRSSASASSAEGHGAGGAAGCLPMRYVSESIAPDASRVATA
eukprot:302174-Chlamydomonas_euryale.AAC.1